MIIRVILLSALFLIGWRIFLRRTKLPVHILVVFGVLGTAAGAVLFNYIAHVVGVGRGADLVTYLVEVGLLFVVLYYYTKFVELEGRINELVREIALLRAQRSAPDVHASDKTTPNPSTERASAEAGRPARKARE